MLICIRIIFNRYTAPNLTSRLSPLSPLFPLSLTFLTPTQLCLWLLSLICPLSVCLALPLPSPPSRNLYVPSFFPKSWPQLQRPERHNAAGFSAKVCGPSCSMCILCKSTFLKLYRWYRSARPFAIRGIRLWREDKCLRLCIALSHWNRATESHLRSSQQRAYGRLL